LGRLFEVPAVRRELASQKTCRRNTTFNSPGKGAWARAALNSENPPLSFQVAGFLLRPSRFPHGKTGGNKMFKRAVLFLVLLLPAPAAVQAQEILTMEPVVVTASRIATPLSQTNSAITVITAEEIEASGQPLITEVLRRVPGIDVSRSGGPGGNVSIFIRGTDNKHTLILVDGVEYNDPAGIAADANIAHLTTDQIERIEIVRGPQSVIYGSDAIGGVINIITKTGTDQPKPQAYISAEGGSYNTRKVQGGFSFGRQAGYLSLGFSGLRSDGFSALSKKAGGREKDGYENTSFSLNSGGRLTDLVDLKFNLRYSDSVSDYDDFFNRIDADNHADQQTLTTGLRTTFHLLDERWLLTLAIAHTRLERENHESWGSYDYDGKKNKLELLNEVRIDSHNTLILGAEVERDEAKNSFGQDDRATYRALFTEHRLAIGDFATNLGVRYDDHKEFGSKTTWRVTPSYTFNQTGTRVRAAIGTGFKAPSLFQLYDGFSGNQDLRPEKSLGYDIGIEQTLLQGLMVFDVTWFRNDISNYINYDFMTWRYNNAGDIRTQGIETTIDIYPADGLNLQLGYTYTDTKNKDDGSRLLKRPLHKGHMNVNLYPIDKLEINGSLIFVGKRNDVGNIELSSYTLVNLATSYQITQNLKLFGRIDNLFDKDYEEVAGYGTAGLSGYAGVRLSF